MLTIIHSFCLQWVEWTLGALLFIFQTLCISQSWNVWNRNPLCISDRKASKGNEVPRKLLKGFKEHKSGATNKLSGHSTAGLIQNLGAAANSYGSESYKNYHLYHTYPHSQGWWPGGETRSLNTMGKPMFAGSLYVRCHHSKRKWLFSPALQIFH